jgi:hypothetical protein
MLRNFNNHSVLFSQSDGPDSWGELQLDVKTTAAHIARPFRLRRIRAALISQQTAYIARERISTRRAGTQ